jgi:hypothetical protein
MILPSLSLYRFLSTLTAERKKSLLLLLNSIISLYDLLLILSRIILLRQERITFGNLLKSPTFHDKSLQKVKALALLTDDTKRFPVSDPLEARLNLDERRTMN